MIKYILNWLYNWHSEFYWFIIMFKYYYNTFTTVSCLYLFCTKYEIIDCFYVKKECRTD